MSAKTILYLLFGGVLGVALSLYGVGLVAFALIPVAVAVPVAITVETLLRWRAGR